MDKHALQQHSNSVAFYFRLVDDAVYRLAKEVARGFQIDLNGHHPNITWTHDPVTTATCTFLDLEMHLEPEGAHQTGVHRAASFCVQVVCPGELQRIEHTNLWPSDEVKHRILFFRCLRARGYPQHWIQKQFSRFLTKKRTVATRVLSGPKATPCKFFLKLPFDAKVKPGGLKGLLNQHTSLLNNIFPDVSICTAWRVQVSVFCQF